MADPRPGPGRPPAGPTHPTPTHPPTAPPPPNPVPAKSSTTVPVLRRVLADGGVESTGIGGPDPYGVSGSGPPLTPAVAQRGRGGGT